MHVREIVLAHCDNAPFEEIQYGDALTFCLYHANFICTSKYYTLITESNAAVFSLYI